MRCKGLMAIMAVLAIPFSVQAQKPYTFLADGNVINETLLDISSRNGTMDFTHNMKVHRSRVWMINYENGEWDFPDERNQLTGRDDVLFLYNGQILHTNIADFSSRRRIFEFKNGGNIHESNVRRIYFCCNRLPNAYASQQRSTVQPDSGRGRRGRGDDFVTYTFLVDGRELDSPLQYVNPQKTGFEDGLQINTKDIWIINFQEDEWYYEGDQRMLDPRVDTIFLQNGRTTTGTVVGFDRKRLQITFRNQDPLDVQEISRIYFCCHRMPDAFKGKMVRDGRIFRGKQGRRRNN